MQMGGGGGGGTYLADTRSLNLLVSRPPGYGALERSFESRLVGGGVEAQAWVWVGKVQGEVGWDVADQRRYAIG